jgi:predicted membrane protein
MILAVIKKNNQPIIMKVIKGAFRFFIAWVIVLYLLFGTSIIYKVSSGSREIQKLTELSQYNGYKVKKLKTDWFGNWVVIKKGLDEEVLNCSDSIFAQLSVGKSIGK